MRHVISALVMNEPGVLARVAGMFSARGFNIDSLVVGRTEACDNAREAACEDTSSSAAVDIRYRARHRRRRRHGTRETRHRPADR